MAVNGPAKGIGSGPGPLAPDAGTPIRRPATANAPPLGGATTRPQFAGGPPLRANSLPAPPGLRAPQGAALPPRRASLPPARSAPWSPEAGMPHGMAQGLPGMGPHPGAADDQMKKLAEQVEATLKSAQKINGKLIETANKATDGVKDAVSPPSA